VLVNPDGIVKTILFDGQVAGNIVSWDQSGKWEVGYWLGKEYWGKGIATKALAEFLKIVQIRPLFAHVVKHNIGSQRVLQKCGFVILSKEKFVENGQEIEEYIMKLE
jgi:RimJ/RimL family protein N-acetyltransferase